MTWMEDVCEACKTYGKHFKDREGGKCWIELVESEITNMLCEA